MTSQVTVFNRFGSKVFEENTYNNSFAWDGKNNQNDLPMGAYYYVVKKVPKQGTIEADEIFTGTVSIVR